MLNGKFRCVRSFTEDKSMLVGKIYEFKNGIFKREDGKDSCKYESIEDFHRSNYSLKIELFFIPQPHKSLLKSGDKVVYMNGDKRFVLLETQSLHTSYGEKVNNFRNYSKDLICENLPNYSINEIWRGDELIAKRIEKSAQQIEIERIKGEMLKLSEQQNQLAKDLEKLEK